MAFFKHPTAVVESDSIGEGTKIWHFSHIMSEAKIGKGWLYHRTECYDSTQRVHRQ